MTALPSKSSFVGLTSTIPVEIIYGAGLIPVDLNNIFITSESPERHIKEAEAAGFGQSVCAWIKGIYSVVISQGISRIIAVTGGDCSNTIALTEILARRGVEVITFAFPQKPDRDALMEKMERLRQRVSASWEGIESAKKRLDGIRGKLVELDRLTYHENLITGLENHLFLVTSSDFNSDPDLYECDLDDLLAKARQRKPKKNEVRLGYLGVPPIFGGFYERIESMGARVVFNEVQRQFSMPYESADIVGQYLKYTYPYEVQGRIDDIREAIDQRALDGLIHYTQTFCFRQLYDIILRENFSLPILTLEGDRPGQLDGRTNLRLETFIEMLRDRKNLF